MRRKVPPTDEWLTPPSPEDYTKPFLDFIGDNPTAWHVVQSTATRLEEHGFLKLSERDLWNAALVTLQRGGKYYVERNGSALIAFIIGDEFETKNGAALVTGHIDACGARCM
jgi:aminopeptidase I